MQLTPAASMRSTISRICSAVLPTKPSQPMPISPTRMPVRPNVRYSMLLVSFSMSCAVAVCP